MKTFTSSAIIFLILTSFSFATTANTKSDTDDVRAAFLNYIEGFYEGDAGKVKNSLITTMFKYGYGFDRNANEYRSGGQMTFDEAIDYAKSVKESDKFPKADAPKKVEVMDIMNNIAAVKITAWWGIDYMLLSKNGDKWMIEQVLWSGVPSAQTAYKTGLNGKTTFKSSTSERNHSRSNCFRTNLAARNQSTCIRNGLHVNFS